MNDHKYINLENHILLKAIIDESDLETVRKYKWYKSTKGNIITWINQETIYLSRFLMNITNSKIQVDHINGDKFDNRRDNLRVCTNQENCQNRKPLAHKKFKGTNYNKYTRTYIARITTNGKRLSLGYYKTEEEAARAYDDAAKKYFGEFAYLNFPEEKND